MGPGNPSAPGSVRVACPDETAVKLISRVGRVLAGRGGATVDVVTYDPGKGPKDANADVWIIAPAEMPFWAAADQLSPIPSGLTAGDKGDWSNLLPVFRDRLVIWRRTAYAVPLLGDAPLCFYRKDLFDDPKHRAGFRKEFGRDPGPPNTWQEFGELAAYFHREAAAGLPPLPAADAALEREYYQVAAPFVRRGASENDPTRPDAEVFGFHFDAETGRPRIADAGFVHALRFLRGLAAYRAAGSRDPAMVFAAGQAVLCLGDAAWVQRFECSEAVRGRFGVCAPPGSRMVFDSRSGQAREVAAGNRMPYLGAEGYVCVVPKAGANGDTVFALLAELCSRETSQQLVLDPQFGGGAVRRDQLAGDGGWQGFGLGKQQTPDLVKALRESLTHAAVTNPVLRLRTPRQRDYQAVMVRELRAALEQDKDALSALTAVAQAWERLDAQLPPGEARAQYRMSLGLDPG